MFREVEEPGQSYRAVDQESPYFDAGTFKLALKHIVQKAGSEPEIVKDVADADLDQVGHDEIIALRHRLEHESIQLAVELEEAGVHRFPGIILLTGSLIGPGKGIKRFVRLSLWRRRGSRRGSLICDQSCNGTFRVYGLRRGRRGPTRHGRTRFHGRCGITEQILVRCAGLSGAAYAHRKGETQHTNSMVPQDNLHRGLLWYTRLRLTCPTTGWACSVARTVPNVEAISNQFF